MVQFSGEQGGGLSISALATQTFRRSSALLHPREGGEEEGENKGETQEKRAINRNAPDLDSRFRGNDKQESVFLA